LREKVIKRTIVVVANTSSRNTHRQFPAEAYAAKTVAVLTESAAEVSSVAKSVLAALTDSPAKKEEAFVVATQAAVFSPAAEEVSVLATPGPAEIGSMIRWRWLSQIPLDLPTGAEEGTVGTSMYQTSRWWKWR